ncbi:TPA: hypothetical protein U1C31_001316 [Streptococcus suis]|nr:hypothetical protein [Streptococcus suis]
MFNKTNTQIHHGQGSQNIDQSITNNFFVTPGQIKKSDSSNEETSVSIILGILIFSITILIFNLAKNNQTIVYLIQFCILAVVNGYVYTKSKNIKTTLYSAIPSTLTLGTTFASFQLQQVPFIQDVLQTSKLSIDTNDIQTSIVNSMAHLTAEFFQSLRSLDTIEMFIAMLYLFINTLLIFSPTFIFFDVIIKKNLKNYYTYTLIIIYWSIYIISNII